MPIDPRLLGGEVEMHGPPPILGPDGQPYRKVLTAADKALLGVEVAKAELMGVRSYSGETIASGMSPSRLAAVLAQARQGETRAYLILAEEMEERDLSYAAALGTRKRALTRLRPTLDVEGVRPDVAQACREVVEDHKFHSLIKDVVDALGKGFSVNEIVWCIQGGSAGMRRVPAGYRFCDPKFFTFDYITKTELRLASLELIDGQELPPVKFIKHIPKMKSGIPIRGGLAFAVAWAWMFKMFTLKDWMSFLDVYGMPFRVGKYNPGATPQERRTLLQAVAGIASDAAAIIPESMQIEFIEAKGFADQPFSNFGTYLDDQISTYVLGQTLTTRDGGSLGTAKVHNEIRIDLLEDDAFELAVTINRDLIQPFVAMNFGADVKAPWCSFRVARQEQVPVIANALAALLPLGLDVAQEDVRQLLGIPSPAPGAALVKPAPAEPPRPREEVLLPVEMPRPALNSHIYRFRAGCSCDGCQRIALNALSAGEPDTVDMIGIDDSADWEAQTGPMLDAIMAAAKKSTSYEEFQAALVALYGTLPTKPLQDRLAIATAKARTLGDITDHP